MRNWQWGCLLAAVLTVCWGAYHYVNQSSSPDVSAQQASTPQTSAQQVSPQQASTPQAPPEQASIQLAPAQQASAQLAPVQQPSAQQLPTQPEPRPLDQAPQQQLADKDTSRVQPSEAAAPAAAPDASPQKNARPDDAAPAATIASSVPAAPDQPPPAREEASRPADAAAHAQSAAPVSQSDQPPKVQKEARLDDAAAAAASAPSTPAAAPQQLPETPKDASRLDHAAGAAVSAPSAPPAVQPDQSSRAQKEASLGDAAAAVIERPDPEAKGKLSYLNWYAYSELPPETKPADTVLSYLKDVPVGTPIEEIRRVSDLLGMDFTFMKAIARIESGFDPKQRTGSYIGLFQLSKYEFRKYGSGNILAARDNAIAAALKMKTEAVLFQMFTRRRPTMFDLYLIHQQGIEGAAEHISQPHRLAWRSMCRTGEGKEKGERWCKRAIWGNTLPALKRTWKNVNNVTSGAFVAMWQERLSHFYGRYSAQAAAN